MERRAAIRYSIGVSLVASLVLAIVFASLGPEGLLAFLFVFSWWLAPALWGVSYWVLRTDPDARRFRTILASVGVVLCIYLAVPVIELFEEADGCARQSFSAAHLERYCPPLKGFAYRLVHGGTFGG